MNLRMISLSLAAVVIALNAAGVDAQVSVGCGKGDCGDKVAPAPQNPNNLFYFQNMCEHPVRMALNWYDRGGEQIDGWWYIDAGVTYYLLRRDVPVRVGNDIVFFFAESTNGTDWSWVGERQVRFDGRVLPMRRVVLSPDQSGNRTLLLRCE